MSGIGNGLQTDRISQRFQKTSNGKEQYATVTYVNSTVANYMNTNSTLNLNIGNGLSVIDTVTGSAQTTIDVGLSARLNDLIDVNASPSGPDLYLKWDGSCWVAGTGLSLPTFKIQDLDNVDNGPGMHTYLHSHDGTEAKFIPDYNLKEIVSSNNSGLVITSDLSSYPVKAKIDTEFKNITEQSTDEATSHYIFVNTQGDTRKIKKSNIDVTQFKNFTEGVSQALAAGLSSTNVNTGGIGLTNIGGTFNLNLTNYLTGAGGILPISQGGTSAENSSDARVNLGLSYNFNTTCYPYQIMAYSQPIFRDHMLGDSVRLVSGFKSATILTGGANYLSTGNNFLLSQDGQRIELEVTTGAGGSIVSADLKNPYNGFPYLYNDFTTAIVDDSGGAGAGAVIGISVNPSYINFGMSSGEDGLGFRNLNGNIQVRNSNSNTWKLINSMEISELTDVTPDISGFSQGDFLIYNGTSFINYNISGDVSVGPSGIATLTTGTIPFSKIDFGTCHLTSNDFQNLTGTTNNIQNQLDNKLYTIPPTNTSRQLLALSGSSATGTSSFILGFDDSTDPKKYAPQIPVIQATNPYGVSFTNLYDAFSGPISGTSTSIINYEVSLLDNTDRIAHSISMEEFLRLSSRDNGGIAMDVTPPQLRLSIEKLDSFNGQLTHDETISIGISTPPSSTLNRKITIQDLLSVQSFTTPIAATYYYTGAAAIFTDTGPSCLGIATGNGSSWYKIDIDGII